jgi:hypothetical protein
VVDGQHLLAIWAAKFVSRLLVRFQDESYVAGVILFAFRLLLPGNNNIS